MCHTLDTVSTTVIHHVRLKVGDTPTLLIDMPAVTFDWKTSLIVITVTIAQEC